MTSDTGATREQPGPDPQDWDPQFAQRSPMFDAFAPIAAAWRDDACFPDIERCRQVLAATAVAVTNRSGMPIVPCDPEPGIGASGFERAVAATGRLGMRRDNWHDLMNLLAWCAFPRTKARLNAAHLDDLDRTSHSPRRSAVRDALTLFDENGVLVACADPALVQLLREFRWRELFVAQRVAVRRSMRFIVVGHGLLDKARAPFVGLTGHACIVEASARQLALDPHALARELDPLLAARVGALRSGHDLAPLPVLGVPGWWPANESPAFYDDTRYFRPGRTRRAG